MATSLQAQIDKAAVLLEALSYLQKFRGETFLIKVGGSAMDDASLVRRLLRDVVFMEVAGINPVIVHGGGKAISAAMQESGLEAQFVGGLRITTDESMEIVEKTLSGVINPRLVDGIESFGGKIDWSLLFQGVLIGASVLAGLRGCKKSSFSFCARSPFFKDTH